MNSRLTTLLIGMVTLVLLVSPFFVAPRFAYADDFGLSQAAEKAQLPGATAQSLEGKAQTRVQSAIGSIIGAVLTFVGVIFLLLMIYGGFQWMIGSKGGKEKDVESAKKTISAAVVGLIIIFAAYALTAFVLDALQTAVTS